MTPHFRLLSAAMAAMIVPVLPATAADYDPPIFVQEAPEYVPVEVGSGWYLRGDIAYNVNRPFENELLVVSPTLSFGQDEYPVSASIGAGYHWNDYFRTELNFGYLARDESQIRFNSFAGPTLLSAETATAENTMWYGMLNGYVDLGTYAGFTPYVGAGIGMVQTRQNYSYTFDDPATAGVDTSVTYKDHQFDMAYTLGAGVSWAATQNLSLDLGYQYLSSPDAEYAVITGPSTVGVGKGVDMHQVKVGLRYDLW